MKRYFPILEWGRHYNRDQATSDLVAAVIVTVMLIPQSLAYALLAGLPAQVGLYASIVPLLAYAVFGTSRALAVGPVAVVSLMTAAAIARLGLDDPAAAMAAAMVLAFLSGLVLLAMGLFRLGFLANFLSHPVVAGFITASGILIATSQARHILGLPGGGENLLEMLENLWSDLDRTNLPTLAIGLPALVFLFWVRKGLKPLLIRWGLRGRAADIGARTGPVLAIIVSTLVVWGLDLANHGVAIVGTVPQGLPPLRLPVFDLGLWSSLIVPAVLISIIGFVESVSVAQTLAAKRRQRIVPDQELIGLGAANIGAAISGGYPVTGGFARSVVNFDAGAETPAAGAFTAVGIALATLALTPLLFFLPKAVLAATIIAAVMSLVDLSILSRAWRYSHADFAAVAATILLTLLIGVEAGVSAGVGLSVLLLLWRTSRPHIAEIGCIEGTEHFRNINRHQVVTHPEILMIRVDESLSFANSRYLEDYILDRTAESKGLKHVVLMCSAVNDIDLSALESLEAIDRRLVDMGAKLHLSEVKGPVTDKLSRTRFLQHLSGQMFLSQYDAWRTLRGVCGAPLKPVPEPKAAAV
ncbi:SulP family inorganic anion transporter [Frigidibacter sp. ROC022]|uniref:SulP family inorganic anion transporter n=1 Tax=Frigidibacter sp. ROC022 TaxID=2971796 RepID=UPI00215AB479|nr:sulfate permease [Frigidibacter sp. ROC022]MCR8724342.1 sulfate permease [Frigidibacter sp. ROC022]